MERMYRKNAPATILAVIKVIPGILALVSLISIIVACIAALVAGGTIFNQVNVSQTIESWNSILKQMNIVISNQEAQVLFDNIANAGFQLIAILLLPLALILFSLILVILDSVGILLIRINGKGAGMVRVIHIIYAAIQLLFIACALWAGIWMFLHTSDLRSILNTDAEAVYTIQVVSAIILITFIVILLPFFCYHKDIARAMNYISQDILHMPARLKRTHLSGLSILFGICVTSSLVSVILGIIKNGLGDGGLIPSIVVIVSLTAQALKYFLVAACNHTLKQYAKHRS